MRIAMVSEHASPLATLGGVDAGGQNVHVAALAAALGRTGSTVSVYTRREARDVPRRVRYAPNVEVVHVDAGPPEPLSKDELYPHMGRLAEELVRDWELTQPQLVHSHFWMSGVAAIAAAAPFGIPVVHTFHALGVVKRRHQLEADTSPAARIPEERRIMREASQIIATCSDEVFELIREGADVRRVSVVPCGVDLSAFGPEGPAEQRSERPRVLVVSRLVPRKGIGNTVAAMANVPGADLLIAGGPARSDLRRDAEVRRLRALARRAGVSSRVELCGQVDRERVPELMRSADVVACVPWYEPFGIVPLEAMACGTPVVASAVGGLVDTVVDGLTGLHVPPRAPGALAAALNRVLGDPRLAAELGAAGLERARARYGWDTVAASTLRTYAMVLARGAGARRREASA
jgi:glycosyltransferase involved in cell wall biosynthesis